MYVCIHEQNGEGFKQLLLDWSSGEVSAEECSRNLGWWDALVQHFIKTFLPVTNGKCDAYDTATYTTAVN